MRWAMLWFLLAMNASAWGSANPGDDVPLYGRLFKVAGQTFTIPYRWQSRPPENANRAGRWHVPLPDDEDGEGAEAVVFYFGPGIGGSAKENIAAWNSAVLDAQGNPATARVSTLSSGAYKITVVSIFGTYEQTMTEPGLPPAAHPKFGFLGAVVETPQGSVYWQVTGPDTLIKTLLPLFNKIVASVKPQEKP